MAALSAGSGAMAGEHRLAGPFDVWSHVVAVKRGLARRLGLPHQTRQTASREQASEAWPFGRRSKHDHAAAAVAVPRPI
jgi:hypothetical protein